MGAAEAFLEVARATCAALAQAQGGDWLVVRRVGNALINLTGTGGDPMALPSTVDPGVLLSLDDNDAFALLAPTVWTPDLTELRQALADARADERVSREADACPQEGEADPGTGLGGADTWTRVLDGEEARCALLGHPAVVVAVEGSPPDGRSDPDEDHRWSRRCAAALRRSLRDADVVCHLGTGNHRVLAIECDERYATVLAARLTAALLEVGVGAVVVSAARDPKGGLAAAAECAEQRLVGARSRRRTLRL